MSHKKFDDLFKESLSGYAPDVPSHIWENIIAGRKKKRPVIFWDPKKAMLLLLAAGIMILTSGIYFTLNKKKSQSVIAKDNMEKTTQANSTSTTTDEAVIPSTNEDADLVSKGNTGHSSNADHSNQPAVHPITGKTQNTDRQNSIIQKNVRQHNNTAGFNAGYDGHKSMGAGKKLNDGKEKSFNATEEDNFNDPTQNAFALPYLGIKNMALFAAENNLSKQTIKSFSPAVKLSEDCPGANAKKYYFDLYVSPDYAIKKYEDTGSSTLVAKRKESLRFHSAFSAGLRYTRVFSNGMSIRTGINFSQINEKFSYAKDNVVQIIYVINNQGDTTDSYYVRGTRYKNSYNNYRTIDVPLVAGYEMGNEKWRANINAGAMLNIYSWQQGETLDNNGNPVVFTTGKAESAYQYKTNIGIGFTAGASLYYKLNNKWYALAEPYFRYNFSPMNKEALSIQERFTTVGLRLGIRIDIK